MKERDIGRLEWIDYLLSAVSSGLAAYTVGQGIKIPMAIYLFCGLIALGTLVSVVLNALIPTRLNWIGSVLYFVIGIASIAAMEPLNSVFPDEGFPRLLLLAGGLSWMMSFGSFFLWNEATLTFQAVPAIALFGLVGAWDTFSGAPFAFFGFLICFAALFSRANSRTMMRQAEDAGFGQYTADANIVSGGTKKRERDRGRLLAALKSGPWRFMAGPEWALGSALVIVLFSLAGAPVIQMGLGGVAGGVRFNPTTIRGPITAAMESFQATGGVTSIGAGPRANLRREPVFRVKNGELDYYRLTTYEGFRGRGWQESSPYLNQESFRNDSASPESLLSLSTFVDEGLRDRVAYEVNFVQSLPKAPVMGVIPLAGPNGLRYSDGMIFRPDGTVDWRQNADRAEFISYVLKGRVTPERAGRNLPEVFSAADFVVAPRVRQFFRDAVAAGKTDYEKARLLKIAIGRRIRYNLEAAAVPAGKEPIEYVLFESREGYCDLFASSMVIGARAIGLPARYVTGFFPANNQRDQNTGDLVLTEAEAHAWAEIYFEGYGWIPFDPTEDSENNTERGDPTYSEPFFERTWVRTSLVTLGLVIMVLGGWFAVKYLKRLPATLDPSRAEAAGAFREFYRAMERATGRPKRPSQTPEEYLEMIQPHLGDHSREVRELSDRLSYGMFGRTPLEAAEVQSLRRQIQDLRSRLRK
jgi:transglutaminase-like putative cysteine protease